MYQAHKLTRQFYCYFSLSSIGIETHLHISKMNNQMVSVKEFKDNFFKSLPKNVYEYYTDGAGEQLTLAENEKAFERLRLRPRLLRDVSNRNLSTSVLGHRISFPVALSPTAMQKMAHPDGEIASVRAAAKAGTIFTLSACSTSTIEEVAQASPNAIKWFQVYLYKSRSLTESLARRAEAAGYSALVLTVDVPVLGLRYSTVRNHFTLPPHLSLSNFESCNDLTSDCGEVKNNLNTVKYASDQFDDALTWDDVHWLTKLTSLPVVVKGILTAEDAQLAVKAGVAAIIVSNHGARQLDGVPSTIEVLPEIVKAMGGRCEVYMDCGIRGGTDVFKALALGANMVFIGRPVLWGLAYDGENGVSRILDILRNELDTTLGLMGIKN